MRKNGCKRGLALLFAGILAMTAVLPVSVADAAAKKQEVDLDGTYHARMGCQTSNTLWVMQMNYYKGDANDTLGTEMENKLFCADPEDSEKRIAKEGTFNEVEISGNGVYTVTLDKANFDGETDLSQFHVATDIPLNDKIKFTDVKAKVNGRTIVTFDEAIMEDEEPYLEGGMVVLVLNHWRDVLKGYLSEHGCSEDASSGWHLLKGDGDDNLSITFTVSGFNKDNPDAVEETPTPVQTKAPQKEEDDEKDSGSYMLIGAVAAGVGAVIAGVAVVVVSSRKKKK